MLSLTKSLCGVLVLTALLASGCKTKYKPAADGGDTENTSAACSDGVDNDADGDIDCADTECQGLSVCLPETDCTNGLDDDNDGLADCLDPDCQPTIECRENTSVACNDGIDNDGDGDTDCDDADCNGMFVCNFESICDDMVDNDNDGDVDCDDPDCSGAVNCGGFCYDLEYQAPVSGIAITEANHDLDPGAACVQYDVVVQATSPEPNTQVCLYIDDLNGAAVGCADPNSQNPMTYRVTLCAGDHTLYARVEQGAEVCDQLNVGLEQIQVTVYEDPSCSITLPAGLSTDSANPTCSTQATMDVEVTSNGADAQLWVGGALISQQPVASGVAAFTAASMGPDGNKMLRAHCENPGNGNGDAWSVDYYITQDTAAPNVQIISPATGTSFGSSQCPFDVVVTGVEAGEQVCAHYTGQTPGAAACSSASTGVTDQLTLQVPCIDGVDLTVEANTQDACGNLGQATILVTADTGFPVALIESPASGQVYNKAADTLDPATDEFEMNIVACTDQPYDPANITLRIDDLLSSMVATVSAAACLGQSHRVTWPLPVDFSQSVNGLQTNHDVEVSISDGNNTTFVQSNFWNDTLAPVIELGCVGCQPSQSFYTPAQDNCPLTAVFDVLARASVSGLEAGEQVTLTVTSNGIPVGPPYTQPSFATSTHWLDFAMPCGVELQIGQNELMAVGTDQAGNPAVAAQQVVSLGSGSIQTPATGAVLSVAQNCSGGANYGIQVTVEIDAAQPDNTPVEVFASSANGGWSYPPPGADVWLTDCSTQGTPCVHTFCIDVPVGTVEQTDISLELNLNGFPVPGGPTDITVDISDPPPPTNPGTTVISRRAAEIQLSWDSVEDPQLGVLSSWDVRCSVDTPLTLGNWGSAMQFAGEPAPAVAGQGQTMLVAEDLAGDKIRAGHEFYCGIRGTNSAGLQSGLLTFSAITDSEIGLLQYPGTIDGYTQYDFNWWYWPSIAPAGDVNDDGYDDLLVGYGGSTLGGQRAAIVLGSATGPTAPVDITCANASFGAAMAGIGDFDNDGYPDIAVGAPDQDRVYIFRGGAGFGGSTFDCSTADVTIMGTAGSWLGSVVAPAGNFDGDAYADIAIGAVTDNGNDGSAYVIFGRPETWPITINLTSGANADGALHIMGEVAAGDYFGDSLSAWDLDKDGEAELIIGIPNGGAFGRFAIVAGDENVVKTADTVVPVLYSTLQVIDYPSTSNADTGLGLGITAIDVDGDGWVDVAVGGRRSEIGGGGNCGNVLIFPNDGAGNISATYSTELHGSGTNDLLGSSVGGMHNLTVPTPIPWKLNGLVTSASDTAVFAGARQYSLGGGVSTGPGYAALWYGGFSGSVGSSAADLLLVGPAGSVSYNWAAYVGDLNGDGYVDLAVGDPEFGAAGRVVLFY